MSKNLVSKLSNIGREIDKIVHEEMLKFAKKLLQAVPSEYKSSYNITQEKNRILFWTEDELAAYLEFGTGNYAKNYLVGKPSEMIEDAWQFKKPTDGKSKEEPYLFPAYYRNREQLVEDIDRRIQEVFDRL